MEPRANRTIFGVVGCSSRDAVVERVPPLPLHVEEDIVGAVQAHTPGGAEAVAQELDEPTEWRLQVKVFAFQRSTKFCRLFVARNESIEDFMTRAGILLKPLDMEYDLLLAGGQPSDDCLSVLLVPAWWRQYNLCTLLVAGDDMSEPAFVNVVPNDCTIADVLPPALQRDMRQCDVYTTFEPVDAEGTQRRANPGDLVFMRAVGAPEPRLRRARDILADSSLEVGPGRPYAANPSEAPVYALLGVGFEHTVVPVEAGAIAPQLAAAVHATERELHFWFQDEPFVELEVLGRPIRRCIGYRHKALHVCSAGRAIFIDARSLGLAVCCRWMSGECLTPFDFASALGLTLPGGFRLCFDGGEIIPTVEDVRRFEHCGSVVLWVESLAVAGSPPPPLDGSEGGEDDRTESDSQEDNTSCDDERAEPSWARNAGAPPRDSDVAGRSRSPRGRTGQRAEQSSCAHVGGVACRRRALPTPCRSFVHPPPFAIAFDSAGHDHKMGLRDVDPLSCESLTGVSDMWNPGLSGTSALHVRRQEDTSVGDTQLKQLRDGIASVQKWDTRDLMTTLDGAQKQNYDDVCAAACYRLMGERVLDKAGLVVSLEDALPRHESACRFSIEPLVVPLKSFVFGSLELGFGLPELQHLCLSRTCFASVWDVLQLCDEANKGLLRKQAQVTSCRIDTNLVCFTDGSYTPASTERPALLGWAVAFFAVDGGDRNKLACIGVVSGCLSRLC